MFEGPRIVITIVRAIRNAIDDVDVDYSRAKLSLVVLFRDVLLSSS